MKLKKENGEVVVEASIVVTIVVIFISIFFYIGMILYQQSLVSIMANQTASNIAQVYSNSIKDPFTGYVDSDSVYQSITYSSMKTDAYVDVLTQKANTLAYYRLKSSRILTTGDPSVQVDIVKKPNELLKSQIIVTIRDKYELPLVSFFGVNNKLEFSAEGRADCVDILEYLNGVLALGDPEAENIVPLMDDTCLVQFFENKMSSRLLATVPVLKGKSIVTSNYYTHSVIPSDPRSNLFTFTGWVLSDGTRFSATTQINGNISVYGDWECTVKFDPMGGTVSPTSKKVQVWSVTYLPTPMRSGWTFLGWFTQKNGAGTQYFSNATVISDHVTLYAHWRCNHAYSVVFQTPGNCLTLSHMKYQCSQCGDIYEADGVFGAHSFGASTCISGATCLQRSRWQRTCSVCGVIEEYEGGLGYHNFEGRCGKTHILGGDSYSMGGAHSGSGYVETVQAECVTCVYCNALWDGITYSDGIEREKSVIRNGQVVSQGMYCRRHKWSNGYEYNDGAFSGRTNTHLH